MKIMINPKLLKLALVIIFYLCANIYNSHAQTTPRSGTPVIEMDSSIDLSSLPLNESIVVNRSFNAESANLVGPYNCEDGLVYILTNTASSNGNVTGLYSYNLGTNTQTLIRYPLVTSTTSSQFINGIGYNVLDNYLYGLLQGTNQIAKIDSSGNVEFLEILGGYTGSSYSSGDIDQNGVLYLYGHNKFISINLNPSSPDYLYANTLLNYSTTVHDITFSPIDNNLYMMTSNGTNTFLRFNTSTNTITNLGTITGLSSETTNAYGTAFMDSMGNMYISNNSSGNVYKIASPHTGNLVATFFNSLSGNPGDGARCPYQPTTPNAVADQGCVNPGTDLTINLLLNDGEGTYPLDPTSVNLIDPNTSSSGTNITISGQGTFTVNASGILTFSPLSGFTAATINYTVSDTVGYVSNVATITVTLNDLTAPTGQSTQEFCENESPTLQDLEVTGNSIEWYSSSSSTTILNPSTLLENGTTYYASQSSSAGCESIDRLAVDVVLNTEIALVGTESLSCINGTSYQVEVTFSGIAPFTASGTGAPGTWIDNGDGTSTWTSDSIDSSIANYSVDFQNTHACNTVNISDSVTLDCLTVPFNCDSGLAYIITNTGSNQNNYVSGLYTLDLATNTQTLVQYPLVDAGGSTQFINGIGFNTVDNYLYGLLQGTNQIAKISSTGEVEYLTISGSFTPGFYSSGDVDSNGVLYLHGLNKFVSIDLNPTSPNYLVANTLLTFTLTINDMAFSPIDGNIYMVTSNSTTRLYRYDIANNTISNLGNVTGLGSETGNSYGTAFMDNAGNMYIANNDSGNIYRIASPHTGQLNATFYSSAMAGLNPGDGARCPNQITLPAPSEDTACGEENSDIIIDLLANDGEGTYALDPATIQLIDPNTSNSGTSITIAGQGTFVVDLNGILTFTPLNTFTEASIQYTVADIMGNISNPVTVTVYLNDINVPTGESSQTFCETDEATVADLDANGTDVQWYNSIDSTTPLDLDTLLVDGGTYYATQTSSNGCESTDRFMVTVTITSVEAPTAEINQVFCEEDEPTVADLVAVGENIQWYDSADSTTPLDADTLLIDQAIYYATQTADSNCESSTRLEVMVTLTPASETPSGETSQVFCEADQPTVADLVAVGENIQWYDSADSTTPLDADTLLIDQAIYYATQTTDSNCESSTRLEVTVTLTPASETPSGETSQVFCEADQPTVADLVAVGENIQWYDSADSTTPLDTDTLLIDQAIYYATQTTDSNCESSTRLEVTVTLTPASETPSGETSQVFCEADQPTVADLVAVGENIQWYNSPLSTTALDFTLPLVDGGIYYASQTSNNLCESTTRLEVTVTIIPSTEAPSGETSQVFCEVDQPTVADLVAIGENIQWYDSATNASPLDASTPLEDQMTYYASQSSSLGCSSDDRLAVTVTLNSSISLISEATATCSDQGTSYTVEFTVSGTPPFMVTGVGAPGTWIDNGDGTSTWTSDELYYQSSYNFEVTDANSCNVLQITGEAPEDCFTPFECADGLVYILTNTGSANGNVTALYSFDLNANTLTLIKDPLIEDTTSSQFVNGIGYNVLDNYIYGVLQNTDKMLKISELGNVELLDITGVFNIGSYSSGDIDENGVMYLYGQNKFVSINLDSADADYLEASTLLNYNATINDVTFSPIDNNLYMITSDGANSLLRFNTLTNTVTNLGTVTGLGSETTNSYGTAFMDSVGNMFIANNASGRVYKIESPQTGGLNATLYSSAMAGLNPGDGARCPNASINPVAFDDSTCITADEDVILDVTNNDASGTYPLDSSTVLLIDPVTSTQVTSVTISGQGTFSVDASGQVIFNPLPSFTGTSVDYVVSDSMGTTTQPATIYVYLNDIEAPMGDATQEFCESINPTIADLMVSGTNILWYETADSETPLDPSTPLIDGETYYATQTSDLGCESVDRLEVTVILNEDITLVSTESVNCDNSGSNYTIEAIFTGNAPFTATGTGAPGTWTSNTDGTYTWISDAITSGVDYTVSFQDVNACNSVSINGNAPQCCTFEVSCPTFPSTTLQCYSDLPDQISYTEDEFELLGNADGVIGDNPCGVILITASNSADSGECSQSVIRTYTIIEYEDTNNNGVHDSDETTILNITTCTQSILVEDTTAPVVTNDLSDIQATCDNLPSAPTLNFSDCSAVTVTNFVEENQFTGTADDYLIIWTWEFEDACGNSGTAMQTVFVMMNSNISYENADRCITDGEIDLFDFYFGNTLTGTWEVTAGDATLDGSTFDPSASGLGDYEFTYTVMNNGCPTITALSLEINDDCAVLPCGEENVVISKAITPNGDYVNDFFEVTGVENCGFEIDVKIFNRWGAMIFESNNYQNNWSGQAHKNSVGGASTVPSGTYYYIVTLENSGLKPFTGHIYVGTK